MKIINFYVKRGNTIYEFDIVIGPFGQLQIKVDGRYIPLKCVMRPVRRQAKPNATQ
ncbi:hypothetical protein SAMN05444392_102294 [Seinonella peptonophila]|uniref:Uncharacterized protein n=1 Tax=Seinonella peptonophila TaxID=112248 RepID=A0A1M4VCL4_9BACL|nr:hypothetical protein [Seinonella peptonophila]SHE66689.1 hypothetical protein SAMN05444392_102294 [Seinonella peptonophila]